MENWQKDFVNVLQDQYELMRSKNSRYSMRSFAKKLGVSIATLSEVMRFRMRLSHQRAADMLAKVDIPPSEKRRILRLMDNKTNFKIEFEKELLPESEGEVLADWISRSVLHSFDLQPQKPSVSELALRLGLTEDEVTKKIQDLVTNNFLQASDSGEITRPDKFWRTPDGTPSDFIRRLHQSNLELTEKALHEVPVNERDFTALMFAGNRQQLEKLRQEIREFYNRVMLTMEEPPKDQLYQMTISLYPVDFKPRDEKG